MLRLLPLLAAFGMLLGPSRASAGPVLTIADGPGGSLVATYNGAPIDEDDAITVVNNSSQIVQRLHITGPTLFAFEGDGVFGGSYQGPFQTFANVTPSSADVIFSGPPSTFSVPGIAPGASAQFGVENESGTLSNLSSAAVTQAVPTPEPTSLALFGMIAAGAGYAGWRRRHAAQT